MPSTELVVIMKNINQQFWSVWLVIFNHKQRRNTIVLWIKVIELHTRAHVQMCAKSVWPRLVDQRCKSTLVCPGFKWTRHTRVSLNQPPICTTSLLSSLPCHMISTKIISCMCMSRFLAFVHFFSNKSYSHLKKPQKSNQAPNLVSSGLHI